MKRMLKQANLPVPAFYTDETEHSPVLGAELLNQVEVDLPPPPRLCLSRIQTRRARERGRNHSRREKDAIYMLF